MRALVLRSRDSTRFIQAGAVVRSMLNRGLDDIVGGLGQAVDDLARGVLDAAGTALKDIGSVVDGRPGMHPAAPPAVPTRGGNGASGGGGTWTHPEPPPTYTPPASGGDDTPDPPPPAHPQDPPPPAAAPSAPTPLSSGATADAASAAQATSTRPTSAPQVLMQSPVPSGARDGRTADGPPISPGHTASATHASLPTGALSGGAGGRGKRFPLAAAAALGCVLGLLVLCAAVWFYRSRRRRRAARTHPHLKRAMSLISATTVSTVPLFISAREAGVADENPFRHPLDADEDDPFAARASWWSASTTRSASTRSASTISASTISV